MKLVFFLYILYFSAVLIEYFTALFLCAKESHKLTLEEVVMFFIVSLLLFIIPTVLFTKWIIEYGRNIIVWQKKD